MMQLLPPRLAPVERARNLKFRLLGQGMDAMMPCRKWDAGIKGFFAGLKRYVERGDRPPAKQ
jgi:hypothetical protein